LGKPIILYAGKIKPHKFFYRVTKSVLERFSLITLREEKSYQNLRKIKFQSNKVFVTADLAFLLKSASRERIQEIMEQEGIDKYSGPFIGMTATRYMAVSALNASKGFSGPDLSYQRHTESLAYVVDDLIDKLDCVVIFIPHCIGFGQELDDRIVAMDIYRICRNKERVKVITNEYGPHELKGLIGYFDLMIGERIHSVISAMAMCVPSVVISLSTDQRLDIIRMIGQEDAICYLENLDTEALLSKIYDTWDRKEEVRNNLRSNLQIIQERAMNNGKLLSQVLNSL